MRRWVRRSGGLALAVLAACGVLTACASQQPPRSETSHRQTQPRPQPSNDVSLIGQWRVTRAQIGAAHPTPADGSVTTWLTFREDGELIDSDEHCDPPIHFSADGSWITLHRPGNFDCAGFTRRTPAALRIREAVEEVTSHAHIRYELRGSDTLTLAAGSGRVVLRRGLAPPVPTTVEPSSPGPYRGSATTAPPH